MQSVLSVPPGNLHSGQQRGQQNYKCMDFLIKEGTGLQLILMNEALRKSVKIWELWLNKVTGHS